ncbi:arsenate reductase ArsC [Sulfurihydrogenibium azorense]|jgi:arsenate reductase|uniref:Protein ArsC (Arsenate reductase) (Arsenical pumpmodifier) (Low molecular weight protein-tyrosine-phosphatase) n=1 Tax=Sulfurihydrogenibium azorense (strain DSM 15241 / OCM 825 / Az-Fu1) TaxID=204536 RepID=C1DUJ5_SULAA|nr:arsenate reductase ArsC [Sulfurihydrogenibium azorense]ACN98817.1 protein ArsC (Arsenate reductase) (Arsenical pumpmodifier) (Low molecular weight protein-tyrosine-phosphatase) [Sulfurihydrogenibium azorense Az-Fu1]MDM7273108.1 arsenate reductase ArsC [Sulfurihydrogenibium azorense]
MVKIAFICTGNSARSQMAEGYAKFFVKKYGKEVEVYSAGSNPSGYVHPKAIQVMKEDGIDISDQYSKHISEIPINQVDYVITLCGDAAENCPVVPGANTQHWNLPDPARVIGPTEDAKLNAFRNVRDEIKKRVEQLIKNL